MYNKINYNPEQEKLKRHDEIRKIQAENNLKKAQLNNSYVGIVYNNTGYFDDKVYKTDKETINKLNSLIDLLRDFKLYEKHYESFNNDWKLVKDDVFKDTFLILSYKGREMLMFMNNGDIVNCTPMTHGSYKKSIDNMNIEFISGVIIDKLNENYAMDKYIKGSYWQNQFKEYENTKDIEMVQIPKTLYVELMKIKNEFDKFNKNKAESRG